jgi:cAMP-dependent protein kinase regulator
MVFGRKKQTEDPQEYIARGEYKKAISLLRDRVSKQPKNASHHLALADALMAANQMDDAVEEYRTLAQLYTHEGFIVKAIAIYKKMLKLRPDQPEIEQLLSQLSDVRIGTPPLAKPVEEAKVQPPAARPLEIETKLFHDLSAEEFQQIIQKLSLRHYEEDTIVVQEGDPGDSLFIIVRGEVRVITKGRPAKKEVVLANLGEGDFFGEVSLLTGRPRTATIITNQDSELLELKKSDIEAIIAKYPNVKRVLEDFHRQRAYRTIDAMIQAERDKD